jgi:glucosylceramidase
MLQWNLSSNPELKPHTERGGCERCLGAVTIAGDHVTRNSPYYVVAHLSKFVRPGSVRIHSSVPADLPNVAFRTPQGRLVCVMMNESREPAPFAIQVDGTRAVAGTLPPGSVATLTWRAPGSLPGTPR